MCYIRLCTYFQKHITKLSTALESVAEPWTVTSICTKNNCSVGAEYQTQFRLKFSPNGPKNTEASQNTKFNLHSVDKEKQTKIKNPTDHKDLCYEQQNQ